MSKTDEMIIVRDALHNIIEGKYPVLGSEINSKYIFSENEQYIELGHIIRVLSFHIDGDNNSQKLKKSFYIQQEELENIKLPKHEIGINQFAKAVNDSLDLYDRKALTGVQINNQLVRMGLLNRIKRRDGKSEVRLTEQGKKRGLLETFREYNGNSFRQIVYGEKGKQFLKNYLIEILEFE